tara:strand:+ start:739 stop:1293 length:555 start_codon:yes stop_codon:yes gene_type:complete
MAIDKIQSESINLADTFAFTGTVTGTPLVSEIDYWVLTSTLDVSSANTNVVLTANWGRYTGMGSNYLGTGMSESSGIFTFPSTGYYRVEFSPYFAYNNTNSNYVLGNIMTTTDNSSYNNPTEQAGQIANAEMAVTLPASMIFDVTNTSTHKVKFQVHTRSANVYVNGHGSKIRTYASFIKLAET